MIRIIYKYWAAVLLLSCLGGLTPLKAQELVGQDELGGRKALVGPDCLVNQFASNVALLGGIDGLENLVDEDPDNYATFTTGVAVGVTEQPLFSVKDMKHTYKAGTEAGICMVSSESGGLLSLNVIQLFTIRAYNNGKLIGTYPVTTGQAGSGVGLDLIKIPGTDNLAVNLTCTPEEDFDELYVNISGGLDISVIKELKFKYAFVGKPMQCLLTDTGIKEYAQKTNQANNGANAKITPDGLCIPVLVPFPIISSELNKMVDDDTSNSCSVTNVLSIGYKGGVSLSTEKSVVFPAGSEVGFVYQNGSALDLKLGNYVDITLYNTDGTEQTERVEAGVLSLVIAEGGKMTSSVIADKEFYKAEISFYTLVSANLGNLGVYYGFVNEPPMLAHQCPINPSATVELCADQTSYQLMSNPEVTVAWSLDESSPCKGNVEVTSSGKVTFTANPSEDGDTYVFRATAVSCNHNPKCYELVTVNRGRSYYDGGCSEVIYNAPDASEKFVLSDDIYGSSGSLISISDLTNPANILNTDWNDYASYVGGLSIASNLRVVGVKTKDGLPIKLMDEEVSTAKTKRVGFVVESNSTFLNADVLQFFQIRCYNDGAEVYRSVVDETNTVGVGLIGEQQSQKVRFSIEVPSEVDFDEFMLWTSGVLKLDLTELRIYYPFIEDATLGCTDPLKCAEMISMANGAMAHPDLHFQTASVAGVIKDLGNLIDGDNSTYFLYQNTVQAGSGLTVKVELGKTMDYHQQLGIIMDNETFLAGVQLGTWMTVETYYQGKATGDKFDNWGVLGLNLIGYGDKNYLICTPTRSYDEVRITFAGIANVLEGFKLYGLFTRNDKNMNGIPDCMDPDQECSVSLGLSVNKICVGENMTLSGTFPVDVTSITLKVPDQDNFETTVTNASPQTDKTHFSVAIPTVHAGRAMPLLVYDANGKYLDGLMYTVYPNRAEWRVNPLNTDWNEPNNWDGNIEPYCCTNVIIPEGATMYPVLVADADNPADTYCCDGIYFEADGDEATAPAQVVNIPELAYHKAWVDVEMMPNRYYMFSAPLKNSHTGDLFVPADKNGKQSGLEFTDLDITNCPQNRFNPRVFQRKWHSTLNVRLLDEISYAENADGTRTDKWETTKQDNADWTAPFNALNHTYSPSEGFSVWVDNGNLDRNETVVFRLPKQHAYYNYYTPDGMMLEEYEGVKSGSNNNYNTTNTSLSRDGNTRFIYEGVADKLQKADERYESQKYALGEVLTITATINEAGDRFMVGNPFMSDIDIKEFLTVNQEKVLSLDRYNGTEYVSYTLDASGNLSSAATGSAVIEPLESVVVRSKSDTETTLVLSFTRDMMLNTVGSGAAQAVSSRSATGTSVPLYVKTTVDGQTSSLMIADSPEAGKSKRLFDSDVKPSVSVSALDEEAVYAIYGTEKAEIPLAVQLVQTDRTVTFHFGGAVADYQREWMLADKYTGETYSLEDTITIASVSTNAGRFVLQNRNRMAEQAAVKEKHVYVLSAHDGKLEIMSDHVEMKQVHVYGMEGKLLAEENVTGFSCVVDGLNEQLVLVRVVLADGSREQLKLMIP